MKRVLKKLLFTFLAISIASTFFISNVSAYSSETGKIKTGKTFNGNWAYYKAYKSGVYYYTTADLYSYAHVTVWSYPTNSHRNGRMAKSASGTANSTRYIQAVAGPFSAGDHEYASGGPAY